MNENQDVTSNRMTGAESISCSAIAMGKESGLTLEKCTWDIGEDISHAHAHRLDLFTELKSVRLYFPDIDLTKSGDLSRKKGIDARLKSAIAQLVPHVPAATYAFGK